MNIDVEDNKHMRYSFLTISLSLVFLASCSKADIEEDGVIHLVNLDETTNAEMELFDLVNDYRTSINLEKINFSSEAYEQASRHNEYMISRGELSHDNFSSRASRLVSRTDAVLVAENVAKNFKSVEAVINGWLTSTTHRETLEGDFTDGAVNIQFDDSDKPYYTFMFFKRE